MGSKLVNLEDLNSKITSSKPVVFSLFVLVLFRLYIFFSGDAGLRVNGTGYHFEILDNQAGTDPGFFQRGGCKYESSRQTSEGQRNGSGGG